MDSPRLTRPEGDAASLASAPVVWDNGISRYRRSAGVRRPPLRTGRQGSWPLPASGRPRLLGRDRPALMHPPSRTPGRSWPVTVLPVRAVIRCASLRAGGDTPGTWARCYRARSKCRSRAVGVAVPPTPRKTPPSRPVSSSHVRRHAKAGPGRRYPVELSSGPSMARHYECDLSQPSVSTASSFGGNTG